MAEAKSRGNTRRPYHSPVRKQQAEQTRERILAAAREKFRSAGYAASTLAAIASGAQVSTKTVEAAYGSKRGILAALVDPLAAAGPPRELVEKIRGTDDPAGRVRLVAVLCRRGSLGLAPPGRPPPGGAGGGARHAGGAPASSGPGTAD